jgi:hypothetical protein
MVPVRRKQVVQPNWEAQFDHFVVSATAVALA